MRLFINRILKRLGYEIRRLPTSAIGLPLEFSATDVDIFNYIQRNDLTKVSSERLIATMLCCKYVVKNDIPGDFVECGVWRGGNALAAKLVFEASGSSREVYLYDTFAGMTKPGEHDIDRASGKAAAAKFEKMARSDHNDWCYASLNDVRAVFSAAGAGMEGVHFIAGDICQTLLVPKNLPQSISVLRLDTDWYESTRVELEQLYPLLSSGGSLLLDDYGCWEGVRKAVDEYFASTPATQPFFQYTDRAGRTAVKP